MARRRREGGPQGGYDDMGPGPRGGDYYAQSENGMPDTRPQRRRNDGRGHSPRPDDRGGYDAYDDGGFQPPAAPAKQGGSIVKTILKVILVIVLMLASLCIGAIGSLKLASEGKLPGPLATFNATKNASEEVDEEDLISNLDEDIQQGLKDGTIRQLLDEAAEDEETTAGATNSTGAATTDPYAQTTTDPYAQQQPAAADPYAQQQATTADPYAQQQATVDPYAQQQPTVVDPTQQVAADPYAQQQAAVDPYAQQQPQV